MNPHEMLNYPKDNIGSQNIFQTFQVTVETNGGGTTGLLADSLQIRNLFKYFYSLNTLIDIIAKKIYASQNFAFVYL